MFKKNKKLKLSNINNKNERLYLDVFKAITQTNLSLDICLNPRIQFVHHGKVCIRDMLCQTALCWISELINVWFSQECPHFCIEHWGWPCISWLASAVSFMLHSNWVIHICVAISRLVMSNHIHACVEHSHYKGAQWCNAALPGSLICARYAIVLHF